MRAEYHTHLLLTSKGKPKDKQRKISGTKRERSPLQMDFAVWKTHTEHSQYQLQEDAEVLRVTATY